VTEHELSAATTDAQRKIELEQPKQLVLSLDSGFEPSGDIGREPASLVRNTFETA
jgi:hypothetical protein